MRSKGLLEDVYKRQRLGKAGGHNDAGEGADGHKACMPQRQYAQKAYGQV